MVKEKLRAFGEEKGLGIGLGRRHHGSIHNLSLENRSLSSVILINLPPLNLPHELCSPMHVTGIHAQPSAHPVCFINSVWL